MKRCPHCRQVMERWQEVCLDCAVEGPPPTDAERAFVAEVAEQAKRWMMSPEGQAAVAAGLKRAEALTEQFRKAQAVDPELLRRRVTI